MSVSQHTIDPLLLEPLRKSFEKDLREQKLDPPQTFKFGLSISKCGDHYVSAYFNETMLFYDTYLEVKKFMAANYPLFKWNQVYLHWNWQTPPHKDPHVKGDVMCIGFGDYRGGEIAIEVAPGEIRYFDSRYKPTLYPGAQMQHWNLPLKEGNKYSFCVISAETAVNLNE